MNETIALLLSYIPAFWRRRWLMLFVVWGVCLVGWAVVAFIPDRYQSSTRIFVDTDSLLRPLLRGLAVETNALRQVEIMKQTLISRPNLEKVIQMADLGLDSTSTAGTERIIARIRSNVGVASSRNNLFSIRFADTDPKVAQKVVQAFLTIFVESNLGTSRRDMDSAQRFINEQLDIYEKQLNEAEQRVSDFKQANISLLPGDRGYYAHLKQTRDKLALYREQLADEEAVAGSLRARLKEVPEFLEFATSSEKFGRGPPSGLSVRIMNIETSLDGLLLRYTEKHPDVIAARRLMEELRRQLKEEMEQPLVEEDADGNNGAAKGKDRVPNEIYQNIKLQLVEVETRIATLKSQAARQKARVLELEKNLSRVPEVEAELGRLTRDYGIIKKNYTALLGRKETAILSENRDEKSDKVKFRIIDPPSLPTVPTGVKRSTYLTMVLGIGILMSLGLGGFIATAQSTFFSVLRLMQATALPVLGSVTVLAHSSRQRSWRVVRLGTFLLGCFALIGSYGGLMVVERNIGLPNVIPPEVAAKVLERLPSALVERLR